MLNINQFRNREFLDEDNKYKREVLKRIDTAVKQYPPQLLKPTGEISPSDRLSLNRLVQSFLNSLDDNVMAYYKDTISDRSSNDLVARWNSIVIFYNTNIDRSFKYLLDAKLQTTDVMDKMAIVLDVARTNSWYDYLDLRKLDMFIKQGNYEIINHVIFSTNPIQIPTTTLRKGELSKIKSARKKKLVKKGEEPTEAERITARERKKLKDEITKGTLKRSFINTLRKKYGLNMGLSDAELEGFTPYERKKYQLDVMAPQEDIEDFLD